MTKLEAKSLTLEVWQYLADHPNVQSKDYLPFNLLKQITGLKFRCPLCDIFDHRCYFCPLKSCDENSFFSWWADATIADERKTAALGIVKAVREWKLEPDKDD